MESTEAGLTKSWQWIFLATTERSKAGYPDNLKASIVGMLEEGKTRGCRDMSTRPDKMVHYQQYRMCERFSTIKK